MNCLQNLNIRHFPSDHCPILPAHLYWYIYSSNSSTSSRYIMPLTLPLTHHPFSCLFFSVQLGLPGLLLLSIPWKHFQLYFPFLFLLYFPGKSTPDFTNHLSLLYLCLNSKVNWIESPTVELTDLLYHKSQLDTQHFLFKSSLMIPVCNGDW